MVNCVSTYIPVCSNLEIVEAMGQSSFTETKPAILIMQCSEVKNGLWEVVIYIDWY
jgi:hypothetical protein